jgi:foldase protein PrsA
MKVVIAAVAITLLAAPAAGAQVFTVTAPSGATYTASEAELDRWTDVAIASGGLTDERRVAFQLLVGFAWLRAEGDERGLVVSEAAASGELERQIADAFGSRDEFRRFLRETHQTIDDVRLRVRHDLLSDLIRDQVTSAAAAGVTDAVVDAYHAEHGNIPIAERRDLRVVLTRTRAEALVAKGALARGANWRLVTRRHSLDETSGRAAGRIPDVERSHLEPALARAVFRARPRRLVGPVRTQFGYYVVRVTRVHPAGELSAADTREIYRQRLVTRAEERAFDRFVKAFKRKWRARTACAASLPRYAECGTVMRGTVARRWNSALEHGAGSPTLGR